MRNPPHRNGVLVTQDAKAQSNEELRTARDETILIHILT